MDIATIAKKTPNLIDLSIGDPDLITDQSIIAAAFTDVKNGHTKKYTASDGSADLFKLLSIFYQTHYGLTFANDQVRGLSWCVTWHVSCLVRDLGSWR